MDTCDPAHEMRARPRTSIAAEGQDRDDRGTETGQPNRLFRWVLALVALLTLGHIASHPSHSEAKVPVAFADATAARP
jgi:hypothetical protein